MLPTVQRFLVPFFYPSNSGAPKPAGVWGTLFKQRLVLTDPVEAAVVDQILVRLARPEEEAEWDRLMIEYHYLKSAQMVGEQLRYI